MPQIPSDPDADLVARMADGDREAFAALFRRHERSVYRFALQMTGAAALADDVTQEVFMALARAAGRYSPSQGTLSTYLYRIARNMVRRHDKGRRLRPEVAIDALEPDQAPATVPDPVDHLARKRKVAAVRQAILRLPPHYREVIVLCELHALSYDEAAAIIGCPIGTVRSRLNRARRMLADRCRALDPSAAAGHWPHALSGVSR